MSEHAIARPPFASVVRAALAIAAAGYAPVGAWALVAPRSFYDSFPGAGRQWISIDGPFNEHLVRDFGALNLAIVFVLIAAAVRLDRSTARIAAVASAIWAVPHFAYHLANLDVFPSAADAAANVIALGLSVGVAALVLFLTAAWPVTART